MKTAPVRDAQTPGVAAVERLGFARFGNLSGARVVAKAQALGRSGLEAGCAVDVCNGIIAGCHETAVSVGIDLDQQDQPEAILG